MEVQQEGEDAPPPPTQQTAGEEQQTGPEGEEIQRTRGNTRRKKTPILARAPKTVIVE